jgi:hypothetical protein
MEKHKTYEEEDDVAMPGLGAIGNSAWIVAEACKVKDALFLGNVMAVQDSNFLVMNKIAYCIKCQTGFSVPQTLKRAGVNYAVMNLLGAFLDQELPAQTKDTLLDNFYTIMESASEQGVGVLLYSFQDLAWCCFAVMAYWVRKYKWTVAHALRIMKSRRPTLQLPDLAMEELEQLVVRLKARGIADTSSDPLATTQPLPPRRASWGLPSPPPTESGGLGVTGIDVIAEEECLLTNTCSNAGLSRGGTNNNPEEFGEEPLASPLTRARPLTAEPKLRIQWGAGAKLAVYSSRTPEVEAKVPSFDQKPMRGIFRRPRMSVSTGSAGVGNLNRFIVPPSPTLGSIGQAPAPVHGTWALTVPAGVRQGASNDTSRTSANGSSSVPSLAFADGGGKEHRDRDRDKGGEKKEAERDRAGQSREGAEEAHERRGRSGEDDNDEGGGAGEGLAMRGAAADMHDVARDRETHGADETRRGGVGMVTRDKIAVAHAQQKKPSVLALSKGARGGLVPQQPGTASANVEQEELEGGVDKGPGVARNERSSVSVSAGGLPASWVKEAAGANRENAGARENLGAREAATPAPRDRQQQANNPEIKNASRPSPPQVGEGGGGGGAGHGAETTVGVNGSGDSNQDVGVGVRSKEGWGAGLQVMDTFCCCVLHTDGAGRDGGIVGWEVEEERGVDQTVVAMALLLAQRILPLRVSSVWNACGYSSRPHTCPSPSLPPSPSLLRALARRWTRATRWYSASGRQTTAKAMAHLHAMLPGLLQLRWPTPCAPPMMQQRQEAVAAAGGVVQGQGQTLRRCRMEVLV